MKQMQFLDKNVPKLRKEFVEKKEKTAVRYRSTGNGHGSLRTPANIESAGGSRGSSRLAGPRNSKKKKKPAVRRSLIRFCECSPSSTAVSFLLLLEAQHLVSFKKLLFFPTEYQLFSFLIKRICQYPLHPTLFQL